MAIAIALSSLVQVVVASYLVFTRFSDIERADLASRRGQVDVLLERELASLENLAQSYAEWIDSYDYFVHEQASYVESNYSTYWLEAQRLDGVILAGLDGRTLWSTGIASLSAGAPVHPGNRDPLLFAPDFGALPPRPVSGFADYGGTLAVYVSWPVTDDAAMLAPRGVLAMIRRLSPELLESFSPGGGFHFGFVSGSQGYLVGEPIVERLGGGSQLVMYEELTAPNGRPLGFWRYAMQRTWIDVASSLVLWLALLTLVAGSLAYRLTSRIVKRRLLEPIVAIRDHLDRFSEHIAVEAPLTAYRDDELGELASHVNLLVERVEGQTRELDTLAATDGLTGLPNRRRLDATLSALQRRASVGHQKSEERSAAKLGLVACCILDVDLFKGYNDRYGHAAGDEALRLIAAAIQEGAKRPGDLPSRYGGEEFALVLPDTDEEGAIAVLERIRKAVKALSIPHEGSPIAGVITISAGAASMPASEDGERLTLLLERADQALYAAKRSGRDRVLGYSSLAQAQVEDSARSS